MEATRYWIDCEEGPWDTEDGAREFAEAEVGVWWLIAKLNGHWHVLVTNQHEQSAA
jgi:hypothetical protein